MTQMNLTYKPKSSLWQKVSEQISQLRSLKHHAVRRRQIVLICESMKRALKGGA